MAGVPSNIITPFVGVEFDNSRAASSAALNFQTLIIGQKTSAGTGTAATLVKVSSASEVREKAGPGSQLDQMSKAYFRNNVAQDTYIYLLEDLLAGTACTYEITFTASSAKAGEIAMLIDGYRVAVAVAEGDTASEIGDAVVAALTDAADNLPITTFLNTAGVVSFAAKNKGTVANSLSVLFSYYDGEVLPSGVTAAFAVKVAGTGDPDLTSMIAALGETWFQTIVGPYTDSTNLGLLEDELASRFGVIRQIDGLYITAKKATSADMITYATASGRNCPHVVTVDCYDYPNATYEIAAAVAGKFAGTAADDPAAPMHRQNLVGILPPRKELRKTMLQRNSLALKGVMTLNPDSASVQTEACVTMYLTNDAGAPDTSYQQVNIMYQLMVARYEFRARILRFYPRAKLADSVLRLNPGQSVITPEIGKAEALAWFSDLEARGIVENMTQFKAQVQCVRDPSNRNRLNWVLPPDFVNQFIVGSAVMQFIQ